MSDDQKFLARWSRRKHAASQEADKRPKPDDSAAARATETRPPGAPAERAEAPLDPASLPPIESIAAGSDIQAFLAPGVPPEVTRAALRRAWSAEPAIRNFIGLSENSWDFNAPDGVPGFGALSAEHIQQLLSGTTNTGTAPQPAASVAVANTSSSAKNFDAPTSAQSVPGEEMADPERDPQPGSSG